MNTFQKGYRHEKKTLDWLRRTGLHAERCRVAGGKFGKQDLWGADIITADDWGNVTAWQVKANKGHIRAAIRELQKYRWPRSFVIHWPEMSKIEDGPMIWDVGKDGEVVNYDPR